MDIEEGFSPIERVATMSIACENRAAFRFPSRKTLLVETGLYGAGTFPLWLYHAVLVNACCARLR
jgi:hypothetical protein